jgi:ribosomal protein L11
VATITWDQVKDIAEAKMKDLTVLQLNQQCEWLQVLPEAWV